MATHYAGGMEITSRYDNVASTWSKKVFRLGYARAYSGFLSSKALATGSTLDVGTGSGVFALSWIEAGGSTDLTLLDPSQAMIEQAKLLLATQGLRPKCLNHGLEELRQDITFDTILASHVLEHFADPWETMLQFASRLSHSGQLYLIVSKPHWCNWLIWLRYRHRWFQPETIVQMAVNAGLTVVYLHKFTSGPPSRTSFGYIFSKP